MHALTKMLDMRSEFAAEPELHAVAVVDYVELPGGITKAPQSAPDLLASDAETALAVAAERALQAGVSLHLHLRKGHVVEEILELAHQIKANLIVIGTHGRKGIQRAILGSACEGVVRQSTIPVLAIKG